MNFDPGSTALGGVITAIIGAVALAYIRVFGTPSQRMEFTLKRDEQEHTQEAALTDRAFSTLERRLEALEGIVQSQGSTIAAQAQQISSLTSQLEQAQSESRSARETIASLQGRVTELEAQLAQAGYTHASDQQTIARLRADLEVAREEIATLRERVQELEDLERQHEVAAKKKAKARKTK